MRQKGEAYFAGWDAQIAAINDQELRSLSTERRQQVSDSYARIQQEMQNSKAAFEPLLSDLKDIGTYLDNNLTAEGMDAVKPLLPPAKNRAITVRDSINHVMRELDKVAAAISAR